MSAAAAVLFGVEPSLTSSQVTRILERHADDVNAASGCDQCPVGRDKYSGWGRLDVREAVDFLSSGNALPASDRFEPNDSISQAHKLWGKRPAVDATLDYWDDRVDVYRVKLQPGQRLQARVGGAVPERDRRPEPLAPGRDVAAQAGGESRPRGARGSNAAAVVPGGARRLVHRRAADRASRRRPLRAAAHEERVRLNRPSGP